MILFYQGQEPDIAVSAYIAPSADIIGAVTIGQESSVWFGAVLRGDLNRIVIGNRTNIQDNAVIHVHNDREAVIGNDVTIGHQANLHSCTIKDNCLIGIGAAILKDATIGTGSIVAAGAVVREGSTVPPRTLMAGVPARAIRQVTDAELAHIQQNADDYCRDMRPYRDA